MIREEDGEKPPNAIVLEKMREELEEETQVLTDLERKLERLFGDRKSGKNVKPERDTE